MKSVREKKSQVNIDKKYTMTRKPREAYQTLTVKLPKEWVEHLLFLEKTTTKSKDYYVRECLFRYLEDMEDLQIGLEILKSPSRTYTSKEADERLKELWAMKGITNSTSGNV